MLVVILVPVRVVFPVIVGPVFVLVAGDPVIVVMIVMIVHDTPAENRNPN